MEESDKVKKLYDSYIYQNKIESQLKYTIMPLLIIINDSIENLEL
jgi:hypothetical protein